MNYQLATAAQKQYVRDLAGKLSWDMDSSGVHLRLVGLEGERSITAYLDRCSVGKASELIDRMKELAY